MSGSSSASSKMGTAELPGFAVEKGIPAGPELPQQPWAAGKCHSRCGTAGKGSAATARVPEPGRDMATHSSRGKKKKKISKN